MEEAKHLYATFAGRPPFTGPRLELGGIAHAALAMVADRLDPEMAQDHVRDALEQARSFQDLTTRWRHIDEIVTLLSTIRSARQAAEHAIDDLRQPHLPQDFQATYHGLIGLNGHAEASRFVGIQVDTLYRQLRAKVDRIRLKLARCPERVRPMMMAALLLRHCRGSALAAPLQALIRPLALRLGQDTATAVEEIDRALSPDDPGAQMRLWSRGAATTVMTKKTEPTMAWRSPVGFGSREATDPEDTSPLSLAARLEEILSEDLLEWPGRTGEKDPRLDPSWSGLFRVVILTKRESSWVVFLHCD